MTEQIAPCPFCGAPAELERNSDHHGEWFNLGCSRHWGAVKDVADKCPGGRIWYTEDLDNEPAAITAWNTRAAPALPEGWSDEILEAMCRAHDAAESAEMGEPSLWAIHDRGDWNDHDGGWETYRADRIAAMRAAVAMLSALPLAGTVRESWKMVPCEPDDAMISAGVSASPLGPGNPSVDLVRRRLAHIYRAMLSASPPSDLQKMQITSPPEGSSPNGVETSAATLHGAQAPEGEG